MEWIKNNPGLSITICLAIAALFIYDMTLGKKFRKRNFEKQVEKNKACLCARCGNKYDNKYYSIQRLNYCSSCFKRMFYDIKLGGGFLALLSISNIIIMLKVYLPEILKEPIMSENFWRLLYYLFMSSLLILWLARSYNELKKAEKEHQRRSALDSTTANMAAGQSLVKNICHKCGNLITSAGNFCTKCGAQIKPA
jgi:hypothetical protein